MHETRSSEKVAPLWAKALLALGGVAAAFLLGTLTLAIFPGLLPGLAPYERREQSAAVDIEFKISDSDMYAWFPGKIRPPEEDTVLAAFRLAWDEDGFRVPARQADRYPIAAFGDSYTEATNVALPWPDRLAEALDVPVRNYGYRDYGPMEVARAAQEFAPKEPRAWLLYAYFSGNDLSNNNRTTLVEERSPFYLMPGLAARVAGQSTAEPLPTSEHYDYPIPVIIGGSYYEMVFFPSYLWAQLAPPDGFEASRTFQIVGERMDLIAQSAPESACLGLIFAPTKEHLYFPFVYPTERQWIRGVGQEPYIDDAGLLQWRDHAYGEAEEADLLAHLDDQHDAIARLVVSRPRWHFIDLLPAFREAVGRGELLYYAYDSHWNQAGHDLAAQVIAESMQNAEECRLS